MFQVAVWLWELCGAHEQVFSKKRKPCVCQPILWVSFRQFFLYVPPANKLSGHLNDLMREIQILRQIYHLCSIRGIGRTIPGPWVSVPLRKPTTLEKGLMACWGLCWIGQTVFLPIQFPWKMAAKLKYSMGKEGCGWVFNLGKGNNQEVLFQCSQN